MKRPAFQFYPADWRNDAALQLCSLSAQGLWMNMLCLMHEAEPYGHLVAAGHAIDSAGLARLVGASSKDVKRWLGELQLRQVFNVTAEGTIYSRRMVRDEKERQGWGERQRRHRDNQRDRGSDDERDIHQDVTDMSRTSHSLSSSSSPSPEQEITTGVPVACDRPAVDPPPPTAESTGNGTVPPCPHQAILNLWHEVLPAMPQPQRWTNARAEHLRARWREFATEKHWQSANDGLAFFGKLFRFVGQSEFLTGRARTEPNRRPFTVELTWLVKPENFAKVLEGKYHPEKGS